HLMAVLEHVDPAAFRHRHLVGAGLRHGCNTYEAREGRILRLAGRFLRQLRISNRRECEPDGRARRDLVAGCDRLGADEGGPLTLERPFELVAADRLLRESRRRDGECRERNGDPHHAHATAIMTSEALITATAAAPAVRPSSSTASLVIDAVMIWPGAISTRTCAVVAPCLTSTILPLIWLRALRRMAALPRADTARL